MQISSRFTIALHIFACVDTFKETHKLTSDFLSQSINVNPVIIRNILTQLKNAGLITVARGTGGVDTTRALSEISFAIQASMENEMKKYTLADLKNELKNLLQKQN